MADTTGRQLILKDGTIIDGTAGYSDGFLWLYLSGYTMMDIAEIFLDSRKTEEIIFQYGGNQDKYDGFINCVSMMIDVDGLAHVCMQKA